MLKRGDLENVSLGEVRAFLRALRWDHSVSQNEKWDLFEPTADGPEIILPRQGEISNLEMYIQNAIETLSAIRDMPVDELILDISADDRDILRTHVPPSNGHQTVSLQEASKYLKHFKDLIAYASAAEDDPQPAYGNWQGPARKMVKHVQFGHTFDGSFGFSIESPLLGTAQRMQSPLYEGDSDVSREQPLERRVMERIMRSLRFASQAPERGADWLSSQYRDGLNANMCTSLATLLEQVASSVTYEARWSRRIEVSDDLIGVKPIQLTTRHVPVLKEAAAVLENRDPESVEIVGRVIELSAREPSSLGSKKTVKVEVVSDAADLPDAVFVNLEAEDYRTAGEIHLDEGYVRATGHLTREGNFWHLTSTETFEPWSPQR